MYDDNNFEDFLREEKIQKIAIRQRAQDFQTQEAYKIMRTNIELSGDNIQTICITSCTPSEGKSTTAFELAVSFSEKGKRTLLIDADLRKSVMRSRTQGSLTARGLTYFLSGQASLQDTISSTDIPNFYMILAGPVPPNPSELLDASRFDEMLASVKQTFDIIIIDTPPLGNVIDAAVVAKKCDGVVFVLASGIISKRFAQRVKNQMSATGCRILGCVLNKVDMTGNSYYGKYYGKYYGNYYGN